jgi:hypothetical protein
MRIALLFCIAVAAFMTDVHVLAQVQQPPRAISNVFAQLFPNPTGGNGYEEFVRAGDLSRNSDAWYKYEIGESGSSLSAMRQVMSDSNVRRALMLVRSGLHKPVTTAHPNMDDETLLPEFALYRSLSRMMAVEMYVQMADGKMGEAISTLGDCLKFSYMIHADCLIGGLVSIAMDRIVVKRLAEHMDQLSVRDCDRLLTVVNDWLKAPDPSIAILEGERASIRRTLQKYRSQPEKLLASFLPGLKDDTEGKKQHNFLLSAFSRHPETAGPAFDQAQAMLDGFYDGIAAGLQKPVWERSEIPNPKDDGSSASKLFSLLAPAFNRVTDRYGSDQAQLQLLGVHAAIHRYKWENDRLPENLEQLHVGALAIDPFSGKPFVYKRLDDKTYDLYSQGPLDRGTTDQPPSGQRVPVRAG